MDRIGIAASKIAQKNLVFYNLCVILLSFLMSLLVFLLAGSAVFAGLWILRLTAESMKPLMAPLDWTMIYGYSLAALTVLVGLVALGGILKNVKFRK